MIKKKILMFLPLSLSLILFFIVLALLLINREEIKEVKEGEELTMELLLGYNDSVNDEINSLAESNGAKVSVSGNNITFQYTYTESIESEAFESYVENADSAFSAFCDSLKEEYSLDVSITVIYVDADGNTLYTIECG